jgi:LmbE family N-acetylglucosaminyl deacetylase
MRSKSLFLSPHNDDEALFGAFTLLREDPFVVVCLRSVKQERIHGFQVTSLQRESETEEAMRTLGVSEWRQWAFSDLEPHWPDVRKEMVALASARFARVYAPAVEDGGHEHHNMIGMLADEVFGTGVTHYMTYTNGRGRSQGVEVPHKPEWIGQKLCALTCYTSQHMLSTGHHFLERQTEFYAP